MMAKHRHAKDIKEIEPGAALPESALGLAMPDLLKNLPLLMEVLAALKTGTGSFSTNSPWGKRWVTVSDHPPATV